MAVKITTLIENSHGEHHALKVEHGLSFYIEKDGHTILFDTGQTGAFIDNAEQLKLDISSIDSVVLSHGHYDHSGGLRSLAKIKTNFKLIIGRGFFAEKYGCKKNSCEYLGNNFDENFLNEQGISYQVVKQQLTELIPDIYIVTDFPRIYKDEVINPRFKIQKNEVFQQDLFEDEILLAVNTPKGLIIILGCSHPGMKNMLDAASSLIKRPIYAVLGGTHLVEANNSSLKISMDYLQDKDIKLIGVSHCTGQIAMDQLTVSNKNFFHNHTGNSIVVT